MIGTVIAGLCSALTTAIPLYPAAAWKGDMKDLLTQRSGLPAVRVKYGGCSYTGQKFVNVTVPERHEFQVVALDADQQGASPWLHQTAAEIIETAEAALRGLELNGGRCWPVKVDDILPIEIKGASAFALTIRWEIWR